MTELDLLKSRVSALEKQLAILKASTEITVYQGSGVKCYQFLPGFTKYQTVPAKEILLMFIDSMGFELTYSPDGVKASDKNK